MAKPSSRSELITYCKRQLGEPVLQVNIDDEQVNNVIDDAIQFFQENCYNGMERCFLRHKLTAEDFARFETVETKTIATTTIWEEDNNYIVVPSHVLGISKVFGIVGNTIRSNLFGIEYQIFLNDLYAFGTIDILNYVMIKQYLETLDMVLNNGSFQQFRYTMRGDRLYLDIDEKFLKQDLYLLIEAHRMLDPTDVTEVYNDMFLKRYATALMKKQWGMNLIKYNNVQLPGGITLNGRQIYEDALAEILKMEDEVLSKYAIPPLDMIG